MADQIIPLTNRPNQSLTVALTVDAKTLNLRLKIRYNEIACYWWMGISDRFGNLILDGVPMLTGNYPAGNLLGQNGSLAIGSAYMINASGTAVDHPDATNLGTDFLLLWGDTAR